MLLPTKVHQCTVHHVRRHLHWDDHWHVDEGRTPTPPTEKCLYYLYSVGRYSGNDLFQLGTLHWTIWTAASSDGSKKYFLKMFSFRCLGWGWDRSSWRTKSGRSLLHSLWSCGHQPRFEHPGDRGILFKHQTFFLFCRTRPTRLRSSKLLTSFATACPPLSTKSASSWSTSTLMSSSIWSSRNTLQSRTE